jgi:hypothetical protein
MASYPATRKASVVDIHRKAASEYRKTHHSDSKSVLKFLKKKQDKLTQSKGKLGWSKSMGI